MTLETRAAAFASRIGLTGLAIAVLLLLLAVQTVRLEGFKLWPFTIEGAAPRAERYKHELDDVLEAQRVAKDRQQAVNDAAARTYRDIAERIDDNAEQATAGALADAERFIAANRVRCPAPGGDAGRAGQAAADRSPGNGETGSLPAVVDGAVTVSAGDVRICTVNTLQAEAARDWALGLESATR